MPFPRKKIYFIFGTLIILLALIFLILNPAIKEIKAISKEIQTQKKEVEDLYLKGQFLEPTKKQYEKISSALPEPQKLFIIKEQELSLITALENIAQKNNLEQKITLQDIKNEDGSKSQNMSLTIKVNGNYPNLIKYLADLESLDYYININNLRIFRQPSKSFTTSDGPINENAVSALVNALLLIIN